MQVVNLSRLVAAGMVLLLAMSESFALNNGVARLPPMGWSSFNQWGGSWTTPVLKAVADSLVKLGLRDCGYTYVNCDGNDGQASEGMATYSDYWPGHAKFRAWATPVADYIHEKGLKFGVYMTTTDNAQASASDIAAAGVDYLKHDDWGGKPLDFWKSVSSALVATGRPVVYSTNSCSDTTVSNMYRTGRDINPEWGTILTDYDQNYTYLARAIPGCWPDADMLEVGCTYATAQYTHTFDEDKSHFAMWCMMASPLIIGFDLTRSSYFGKTYSSETYTHTIAVLSNTEIIAVDQDSLCKPGRRIKGQNAMEVWVKDLKDGSKAVAFFNRNSAASNGSISQAELGWGSSSQIYVRDLWTHQNLAPFTGTFTQSVATHLTLMYRMSTQPISPPTETLKRMDRAAAWLSSRGHEVFPRTLDPSVLAGMREHVKLFDVRGRVFVGGPVHPGAGVMVLRSLTGDAAKAVCPGSASATW